MEAALHAIEDDANTGSEAVRRHEIALKRAHYEAIARVRSTMPSIRGTGWWLANWSAGGTNA